MKKTNLLVAVCVLWSTALQAAAVPTPPPVKKEIVVETPAKNMRDVTMVTLVYPLQLQLIADHVLTLDNEKKVTIKALAATLIPRAGETPDQKAQRKSEFSAIVASMGTVQLLNSNGVPIDAGSFDQISADKISIRLNLTFFAPEAAALPLMVVNDEPILMNKLVETLGGIHQGKEEVKKTHQQSYDAVLKRQQNIVLLVQEAREIGLNRIDEVKPLIDSFTDKRLRDVLLRKQVPQTVVGESDVEKRYVTEQTQWRLKFLHFSKRKDAEQFMRDLKKTGSFDKLYLKTQKERKAIANPGDGFTPSGALQPVVLKAVEKTKVGGVTPLIKMDNDYFVARVLEKSAKPDDPGIRENIRKEVYKEARLKAIFAYRDQLIKKYAVVDDKFVKELNLEAPEPGLAKFRKDGRVIATIAGEPPLRVADLIASFDGKYFHGVDRLVKEKKINKLKDEQVSEALGVRLMNKEARTLNLQNSEEFITAFREYEAMLLFGAMMEKVVRQDVKVTDKDIEEYYLQHKEEYLNPEKVTLEIIPFKTAKQAENALVKLKSGIDLKWFKANAEGALAESMEFPVLTVDRTELKDLPEGLQKLLADLKGRDVRLYAGKAEHDVIVVTDFEQAQPKPMESLKDTIYSELFQKKMLDALDEYCNKLREQADIQMFIKLGKQE